MQIGDLVRTIITTDNDIGILGVIVGFDKDDHPIVIGEGSNFAWYRHHLEVINESR